MASGKYISKDDKFPIVGIGASAGGLEAFRALLKCLPPDTGMAFVLVQHLDPAHKSALSQILGRATSLPVLEAANNLRIQQDQVYVIPPNTIMTIEGGVLKLSPRKKTGAQRSIDVFFESLAQDQHESAMGVILSGTATDGTIGLEAIKAENGITFAQDETAKYDSMPRSAVISGCVDFVLSPEGIAKELAWLAKHPYLRRGFESVPGAALAGERVGESALLNGPDVPLLSGGAGSLRTGASQARSEAAAPAPSRKADDDSFKHILVLLHNHSGVDFSLYKSSTIQRRVTRRMVLSRHNSLGEYAQDLEGNVKELDALYSDVLITVTSFFRNPETFECLKRKVFGKLLTRGRGDEPVRAWVIGCSTGQEAYSIAMAFVEARDEVGSSATLQVFATDLNESVLHKARQGLYTRSLAVDLPPDRLRRFFVEEEFGYRITKCLRDMVIFARQNLTNDPPFSRMDLISCRNVLIYFDPDLQKKALPTFHYALKPQGYLFLGASESVGAFTHLFDAVDKKHKIFIKKAAPTPADHLPLSLERPSGRSKVQPAKIPLIRHGSVAELDAQREADRITVNQFAPPGVLISEDLQIVQFRGPTRTYLEPPIGKPTSDVLKMAREGLMLPLRAAIEEAKREHKPARKADIRIVQNEKTRSITIEVVPLKNLKERHYLILFDERKELLRENEPAPGAEDRAPSAGKGLKRVPLSVRLTDQARRIAELERELAETRDYVQSIQERYEATTEELQNSNEEVQSSNEELQSVNDELETSKEELESINEELVTVNEEVSNRNAELNRLNSDLNNLQVSLHTPILLLGRDLTIRRFTPLGQQVFNLLPTDAGRPLSGIRHNLDCPDLERFVEEVIRDVRPAEREVRDKDGRWYVLRVRPYITSDNQIEGAVLVLIDITERKKAEGATFFLASIADSSQDSILSVGLDGVITSWNRAAERLYGYPAHEAVGKPLSMLSLPSDLAMVAARMDRLTHGETVETFELERCHKDGGQFFVSVILWPIKDASGRIIGISVLTRDVNEQKKSERALRDAKEELGRYATRLEETVRERTAALRETVAELEAFSYSIAHDMRAPLRGIRGFADILLDEYAEGLDAEARHYLERIAASASRLDLLIQDVLNYTRVLRADFQLAPVNLDRLVQDLVAINPDWQPPKAGVSIPSPLPQVVGNEALLGQCVSNLIGNAVKFVAPGAIPQVRIRAEARDDNVRVWFEDNGIGIEPENRDRIFRMFERIHPSDEFEGTGIGLTIVRKAVERMEGKLGFDSQPGTGSRFWIELKKAGAP